MNTASIRVEMNKGILAALSGAVLLLGGCGGGGGNGEGGSSSATVSAGGTVSPGFSTDAVTVLPTPAGFRRLPRPDRDEDGLPDDIDPAPGVPAMLDETGQTLELRRVLAQAGDHAAEDTIHADLPLRLEIFGPAVAGETPHIVLLGTDDIRVVRAEQSGADYVLPPSALRQPVDSVYAVTAQWRTAEISVRHFRSGQPLLVDLDRPGTADAVTLYGIHLEDAAVTLDEKLLELNAASPHSVTLALPPGARSGSLAVVAPGQADQQFALRIERPITLTVDAEIGSHFPELVTDDENGRRTQATAQQITVQADTAAPDEVRLDVPVGDLQPPVPLGVVAWPDRKYLQLNIEALVESLAWRSRAGWGLADVEWPQLRSAIDNAASGAAGTAMVDAIRDLLNDRASVPADVLLARIRDFRAAVSQAVPPSGSFQAAVASAGISQGEALGQNVQYVDSSGNFGINGEFALFEVGSVFDLCAGKGGRPASFRPSDLCLVSANELASSVAVRRTQTGPYLRNHINPNRGIFNADIIGGTGGFLNLDFFGSDGLVGFKRPFQYLEASNAAKDPLCGVEPCWVEVITGGFGVGTNTPLTPGEKRVSDLLRRRALIDLIVMPVLGAVSGNLINDGNASCIAGVAFAAFDAASVSADFYQKASGTVTTRTGSDGKPETIVDYNALAKEIQKFFQERLVRLLRAQNGIVGCFDKSVVANINERLSDAAGDLAGRFTSIVGMAVQTSISAVQFATTPPRIVFRARPQLSIDGFSAGYDLNEPDAAFNNLRIEGTAIAEDQGSNAFLPDLVLGGVNSNSGNFEEVPFGLTQANYTGGVAADNRRIEVAQNLLRQFLFTNEAGDDMQAFDPDFEPGEVTVALRYTLPESSGFTDLDVDVPVGRFNILGPPAIDGYRNNNVRENDFASIIGFRLNQIDLEGASIVLEGPGSTIDEVTQLDLFIDDQGPELRRPEIEFRVPALRDNRRTAAYNVTLFTGGGSFQLPQLVISKRSAVGTAAVSDDGACQDDRATVTLISDSGNPVIVADDVPEVTAPVSGPDGDVASFLWVNDNLAAGNKVAQLRVTCVDAGDDCRDAVDTGGNENVGVCTLGLLFDDDQGVPGEQILHLSLEEGVSQTFP